MRLTIKLTVVLVLVIIVFMSVQAVRTTTRLTALHKEEIRDDLLILAGTLGTAVAELYRSSGPERALEYVHLEGERRGDIRVLLEPEVGDKHALSAARFVNLPMAQRQNSIEERDNALIVPLAVGTEARPAILELRQSLDVHRSYVDGIISQQIVSTVVLALLCGTVLLALGLIFIGQPVKLLLDQARTVADGDFSLRVAVRQDDEIGTLAEEMNRMGDSLEAAWEEVLQERRARTAALAQLRHADRLSTVGKIASGMAHELGTPLNVVAGRASMISSADNCPSDIAGDARIIAEQATHMTQIIRQLLDFSRSSGLQRRNISIHQLIERASLLVDPLAEEQQVSIELAEHPPVVAAIDECKALQVLTNLMLNGIQAMPDGGVLRLELTVENVTEPPEAYAAPGDYVRISISDQGVGIDVDTLEHIFEPFFTTKSAGEGTGLGLSVCHGIVKEHGGWIGVESTPGAGSTFSIYFPQGDNI